MEDFSSIILAFVVSKSYETSYNYIIFAPAKALSVEDACIVLSLGFGHAFHFITLSIVP
jgi:hypothetical protein